MAASRIVPRLATAGRRVGLHPFVVAFAKEVGEDQLKQAMFGDKDVRTPGPGNKWELLAAVTHFGMKQLMPSMTGSQAALDHLSHDAVYGTAKQVVDPRPELRQFIDTKEQLVQPLKAELSRKAEL